MIKAKVKKIIAKLVAATMVFTMIPLSAFATTNDDSTDTMLKVSMPMIAPTPQDSQVIGDGFIVTNNVNIIGGEVADEDAKRELLNALEDLGININEEFNESNTTIILGEKDDEIIEMDEFLKDSNISSIDKSEGYVLASKKSGNGETTIAIEGNDEVGTFYGVETLKQLLINNETEVQIPEVTIQDYPSQKLRGVVEGFYGTPWSQEDRLSHLDLYSRTKMNTYIYAPKSDPYHRDKWREPYPVEEMDRMQELINTATELKVDFVFAISPGVDIRFNEDHSVNEEDYAALLNKCQTLYDMGVKSFAIFWDDISNKDGVAQASVLNRFNEDFIKVKGDVKPLITVPQEYWGASMGTIDNLKAYTKGFSETLDDDIEVMWTGDWVVSEEVTYEDAQEVKDIYGKDMLLWWNYPVNDYREGKLALGPIYKLDKDLDENMSGTIINPMKFAEASKISIHTGAEYAWNTKSYDYEVAWDKAIEDIVGEELKDAFKIVADHSTRVDNGREDAPEMKALMDSFWSRLENKENFSVEVRALKDEFTRVKEATTKVKESLYPEMMEEVSPQLDKLELYAEGADIALDMILAVSTGNNQEWWTKKAEIIKKLEKINAINVQISDKVLDHFIKTANEKSDEIFFKGLYNEDVKEYKYEITSTMEPLRQTDWLNSKNPYEFSNIVDNKVDTAFRSNRNIQAGDSITFDLGEVESIENVYMLMGRTPEDNMIMKGKLEYSVDGSTWTTLKENNEYKEIFEGGLDIEARYIKYTALENQENEAFIREFKVNKDFGAEVTSTMQGLDDLVISKEIVETEEIYTAVSEKDIEIKKDDNITMQLIDYKYISGATVSDNLIGELEYSINGLDWFKVSEIQKPVVARFVRFTSTEDSSITDEIELKVVIEGRGTVTSDTNIVGLSSSWPQYNNKDYAINGDYQHPFISSKNVAPGMYYTINLGEVKNVRNVQILADKAYGADRIRNGVVEYSVDGVNWEVLREDGEIPVELRIFDLDIEAQYIRITSTGATSNWFRLNDFSVNNAKAEVEFNSTVTPVDNNHRLNNLNDGNILTSYIPSEDVKDGDSITYNLGLGKQINRIHIFQKEDTISNAKVIARTVDDKYIKLGKLEKGYNSLELDDLENIISINIEFEEGMGRPEIYEIVTENNNPVEKATKLKVKSKTSESVTLTWEAPSKGQEVKEYIIYQDAKAIYRVDANKELEYVVEDLDDNMIYGFKVVSVGTNNTESKPTSVNVRTAKK